MPVCGGVKAYNERSFCVKYYSQWVQTSFYDSTPSASNSLGNTISQRVTEDWENARADFPNASEEHNLRDISRHSRVLIERIPGTQGIWRVAPSYRLKTTKLPRQRSSLSHAHHKLSAEYRRKRRLRIQNRSAGCVLLCTDTSEQQKVPMFCLQKQGMSVSSTSLQSEHCPSGIYSPGTHSGSLPPSSGDSVSRRLADSSSRPSSVITSPVSVTTYTEHGRLGLNEVKSELEPIQDIKFMGLRLHLDQMRASLPISKVQEIMAHACQISSKKILSYTEVSQFMGSLNWASGLIPLGRLHLRPLQ